MFSTREDAKVYLARHNWGNSIYIVNRLDDVHYGITGQLSRKPRVGDLFVSPLGEGRVEFVLFGIESVEHILEQPYKFYGTVASLGYIEEFNDLDEMEWL